MPGGAMKPRPPAQARPHQKEPRRDSLQAKVDATLKDLENIKQVVVDNGWGDDVLSANHAVELRRFLAKMNLLQYAGLFQRSNLGSVAALTAMTAPDLAARGVKMGHALRLLNEAQGYTASSVPPSRGSISKGGTRTALPSVRTARVVRSREKVQPKVKAISARGPGSQGKHQRREQAADRRTHIERSRQRMEGERQWSASVRPMSSPKHRGGSSSASSSSSSSSAALARISPPQSTPSPPTTRGSQRSGLDGQMQQQHMQQQREQQQQQQQQHMQHVQQLQAAMAPWVDAEDATLLRVHEIYGNRWTAITKLLPGRTVAEVKQRWAASR